ncbi:MAG: hypothetical protein N3E37_02460 [Candidatus Micrarchaeota archaeon]|nr:hypothetical protein [Candidatus Micrarchaeota archaeon]
MGLIPESQHIISELKLRKMNFVEDGLITKKSIVRWLCLALGLISEKESRQLIITMVEAALTLSLEKNSFTSNELITKIKELDNQANEKAIRYHISQLKKSGFLYEKNRDYYLGNPYLGNTVEERLKKYYQKELEESFINIEKAIKKFKLVK